MDVSVSSAPPPNPSPPLGSLGKALGALLDRPIKISLGIAFAIGLAGPVIVLLAVEGGLPTRATVVPWIWLAAVVCIVSLVVACAVAAFLPSLLLTGRDRAASVVHNWVGAREVRRIFGSARKAIGLPTTPAEAEAWLSSHPDRPELRPLRFEMLVFARHFDDARALIDLFPRATALDQYRIAEAKALVEDQTTGVVDDVALAAAAARVPAGVDRAEAMASLAVLRARRLIGRGDWRAPFVEVRPHIPGSDVAILVRDFGAPIFSHIWPPVVLPIGGFIVLVAVAITVMALA